MTNRSNPARALYRQWHSVLDAHLNFASGEKGAIFYGHERHGGIGVTDYTDSGKPILGFGWAGYNHLSKLFEIGPTGEFRLWVNRPSSRLVVDRHTFLACNEWRGWNWEVAENSSANRVSNWQQHRHYVNEQTMRTREAHRYGSWRGDLPWMKVQWSSDHGWHIAFARDGANVKPGAQAASKADFDRMDALRAKRYRLLELGHRRVVGEVPWPQQRHTGSIETHDEREERHEAAVAKIVAHLDVTMPARSIPLRRNREGEGLWPLSGTR